jgi:hypothetical protein
VDFFRGFALTSNTVKSYRSQYTAFVSICDTYGVDSSRPLDELDLCLVMSVYADSHKITTAPLFISALAHYTRLVFNADLPRNRLYQETRRGLDNFYGNTNVSTHKTALTQADLVEFDRQLDTRYFEHARDWCACLLAFFGLLRINEYMNSGLRMRHVTLTAYSVDITVYRSKTTHIEAVVSITARGDTLCPVRALSHYLGFFKALHLPHRPEDPLFVTRLQDGTSVVSMSTDEFITRVRALITSAFPDRDATRYAGHSFRRGGASALQLAGVPAALIQRHGRWTSDAYRTYIDSVNSPAMRLLATRSLLPAPLSSV